jgi:tryptophan-rich sensory protein
MDKLKSAMWLFFALAACFGTAAFGAQFMPGEWYQALNKPWFNPPAWLFGPVWTLLYALMAISWWRLLRTAEARADKLAHTLFAAQLLLNGAWSALFFGLHRPGWALAEIILLLAAILLTAHRFRRHDVIAAWLLSPYALWVSFATVLNASLWWLNR